MSNCIVYKNDPPVSNSGTATRKLSGSGGNDKLFDPSIDMMVNDFDDERTLEEEEALAAGDQEDANAELSSLQREGDMPLDELLALYGYGNQQEPKSDEMEEETIPIPESIDEPIPVQKDMKIQLMASKLQQLYEAIPDDGTRSLRITVSRQSDEEDDDYDFSPDEDEWKKTIMVGNDYQANIPEGLCSYDDALPYENEDKLLWDPNSISEENTEDYLRRAHTPGTGINSVPKGRQTKDDEQALFLLLQCGHNVDEALRRRRIHSVPSSDTMSLWSEEECRNFECGLRSYGKDFHLIQQNKVRTRSVGELVQFYYLWKKTERHDVFANKTRLEKKKYTLHPGLTDFMDRFLEEQDGVRDRSSSPNVQNVNSPTDNKKLSQSSNNSTTPTPTVTTTLAYATTTTTTTTTTSQITQQPLLNNETLTIPIEVNLSPS